MTRAKLHDMTVAQLVDRFEAIALAQDEAILYDEHGKYNRLYDEMDLVKEELKSRAGDQRRALLPLLTHSNAQVRLKATIATLALAPNEARRTLQSIIDGKEYPEAADAWGMLEALDEGRYKPS